MFLHPRRAIILHALALVAGSREPLDRGFAAVAASDRLLQRWVPRLCPPLAAGEALATVLRRNRLVGKAEAELIEHDRDTADALRRVAGGALRPLPGALIARWYLSCLTACLGIGWLAGSAANQLGFGQVMRDLNIKAPLGYAGLGGWLELLLWSLVAVGVVWCIEAAPRGIRALFWTWRGRPGIDGFVGWLRGWLPAPPDLQLFWAPESCQCEELRRCIESARVGRMVQAERSWRGWWSLARWRLPPAIRHGLATELLLERRLLGLGVLAISGAGPDWGAASGQVRGALREALADEVPLLRSTAFIMLLIGILGGLCGPLISVVTQLGGGGF